MLRIDDTDDDVDLRPRRPPDERRYEERGVNGAGDADSRRTEPEPWVEPRGRVDIGGTDGVLELVYTDDLLAVLCLRLPSVGELSGSCGDCPPLLALEFGDRARLDVSFIQFRSDKRCPMMGCFRRCLGTKPFGERRSGLLLTTCSMLPRDLRLSKSLAGSGGRDVE